MKKFSTFIIAVALIFGMAQCKKQEIPATPNADLQWVHISLKVDGDRHIVYPTTGAVVYTDGDKIYVSNGNLYRGVLTYGNGTFTGDLAYTEEQPMATDDSLHFYFLGGSTFVEPTPLQTTSFTVNISDQSSTLPVLSYGTSKNLYTDGTATYSCLLENKCALVKFDLGGVSTDAAISLTGMKTEATIDFAGTPVTSGTATGNIVTNGTGTNRYAIVLSDQSAVEEGTIIAEGYTGTFSIPTAAYTNAFLSNATMTLINPLSVPLTLEVITGGTIKLNKPQIGMQYSLNGGEKITIETTSATTISDLVAGDKVQFYGNGTSITSYKAIRIAGGTATVKVYGNIMSLVDEENFASASTLNSEAFSNFFYGNTYLTDASGLQLPATTLAESCYKEMFRGCSNLTAAPVLPATTLAYQCYYGMFYGCTSMTTAPELPVTTLAENCYGRMFYGCSGLTATPVLPATTMVTSCYGYMFYNCTGLTTAPVLPAMDLAPSCYSYMFYGCRNLTAAPALPATTLAINCYNSMFRSCTYLTSAPVLPAPALVAGCYETMFESCLYLSNITCLATSGIGVSRSTGSWLNNTGLNVSGTKTFTRDPNVPVGSGTSGQYWPRTTSGIPTGWDVIPPVE